MRATGRRPRPRRRRKAREASNRLIGRVLLLSHNLSTHWGSPTLQPRSHFIGAKLGWHRRSVSQPALQIETPLPQPPCRTVLLWSARAKCPALCHSAVRGGADGLVAVARPRRVRRRRCPVAPRKSPWSLHCGRGPPCVEEAVASSAAEVLCGGGCRPRRGGTGRGWAVGEGSVRPAVTGR